MLDDQTRADLVAQYEAVYAGAEPLVPPTQTFPDMEEADAYAIQQRFIANRVAEGAKVAGYKVGLTSKAMQDFAGTTEPDFSALLDTMFIPEAAEINAADWFDPLVEIEIAFVLKDRLSGPNVTAVDVIRATDFILPAIELVDFRIKRALGMNFIDTVSDLAAVGAVIVGGNPARLDDVDVRAIEGVLSKNDRDVERGHASAVLGNPVNAVAWLARKLHSFGIAFEPGQLILTGSFVRAVPVGAGDRIVARYDSGFGDVRVNFV